VVGHFNYKSISCNKRVEQLIWFNLPQESLERSMETSYSSLE